MLIEFAKGTKWEEINSVLSMFERDYDITLLCASTWQITSTKENYTTFELIIKKEI